MARIEGTNLDLNAVDYHRAYVTDLNTNKVFIYLEDEHGYLEIGNRLFRKDYNCTPFKPGARVTCKHAEPAYYSAYGGNPSMIFRPGMVAVVQSLAPKVCIAGEPPLHDRRPYFLVCDYTAPETGRVERVGLNFCNAEVVD